MAKRPQSQISPIDRYLVADAHRDDGKHLVVRGRFSVYCGGHALLWIRQSNNHVTFEMSCNSRRILRYKKSEQYQVRRIICLTSGLRSRNIRARNNHHSF